MLRLMRDYATSWMIKFILGVIVIVFVFWGVGSFTSDRATRVALVNDQIITVEEYREAYNNLIEQVRRTFGSNLNDDMIKMLNLKQQALNNLIDQALLVQQAETLNFKVSDHELATAIQGLPAFQRGGAFDNRLYENVLSRVHMTPEQFEESQRKAMLNEKIRSFITGSVKVSEQEAMTWYNWQNALVNVEFVRFDPSRMEDLVPTDEAVRAFFDKDPSPYKTEPKVKARYLKFSAEDYRSDVSVSDAEIEDYYREKTAEFTLPKTVEARHILFKVEENATEDRIEAQRRRALEVLGKIRNGKDFAEMAKTYSEGPSKAVGGYLGAFKREQMVAPFSEKAFSMAAGEISDPVRTRFGWHLIKVEKVNDARVLSLAEATPKIRNTLTLARAKYLAYDEAEAVFDGAFEPEDLVREAMERDLKLVTTDFFTRSGPQTGVQDREKFATAAFGLPKMEISDILDLEDAYYILQVIDTQPERIPEFNEVKDRVRSDLLAKEQEKAARERADAFLAELKAGKSMAEAAAARGLKPVATGLFQRNAPIPEIGRENEITRAAFNLSETEPLAQTPLKGQKGYYVLRRLERKAPDPKGFEKDKEPLMAQLLGQKRQQVFSEWLAALRSGSQIVIEEEVVQ